VYLQSLYLQNVRNLATTTLEFAPGFNFIYGDNGAGKTALLEAIYILSRGRSFRSHKVAPIICHEQKELLLRGEVIQGTAAAKSLAISKSRNGDTAIRVGGDKRHKVSDLAKQLPVQVLLPDAAQLIYGGPGGRRGFVDWGLFHVEQNFLDAYSRYQRVLSQRNAWLKTQTQEVTALGAEDPWSGQLLNLAVTINSMRQGYVEAVLPYVSKLTESLNVGAEIGLSYDWGGLESREEAEKRLVESMPRDVKFGTTHRGPHRGELQIWANSLNAAEVLSRGQAKLVAAACILAQAEYLHERTGIRSIFLVDDFGAELDPGHWRVFLDTLNRLGVQVIATGTTPFFADSSPPSEASTAKLDAASQMFHVELFHVEQGTIARTG